MNSDFVDIVSPRQLRRSPERGRPSGLKPPSRIGAPQSRLRAPSGIAAPPTQPALQHGGIRPPSASGLRPPGGHRPPTASRTIGEIVQPPAKVIPLPGPSGTQKLAAIPNLARPVSGIPKPGHARIVVPVARAASTTSLLPKPSFLKPPTVNVVPFTPKQPAIRPAPQVPRTPKAVGRPVPKTPVAPTPVVLPRTAAKKRVVSQDPSAEMYNIGGRDVQFVDYEDSPVRRGVVPRPLPMDSPESPDSLWSTYVPWQPSQFMLDLAKNVPDSPPKKLYVSEQNPTAQEIKEFHEKVRADLERSRKLVSDMQQLYDRKTAALEKLKAMYEAEEAAEQEPVDLEAFRERYGVTQSPKMRQLLEVTGEWNRDILERRQLEEGMAKAGLFAQKERIRRVPTLESIRESEGGSPVSDVRRLQFEQARQEKIDEHKQRIQVQQEYQRLMEDRKRNIASRRPYSKQEREEIRKRYQEAQEWTYTALTEEELDAALKRAEMIELEEEGVSMQDSPKKIVEALFPDAAPSADISGIACDVLIPAEIPVDKMNTMNSLDHSTAEIALKASSIPAPAEDAAKKILADSLQQMATTVIEPAAPPPLDPMYEIDLKLDRPKRQNYIQLQGSTPPVWFPGYYAIFPGAPGLVQATKSPSSTLLTAWRKMQPSIAAAI